MRPSEVDARLPLFQRRWARQWACWNGALWATGNGLASSALVIYVAIDLGAPRLGLGIAMLRAAPHLAGLLRLGTPLLIDRLADRKQFCVASYLLSALVLCALPWLTHAGLLLTAGQSLALLIVLWCIYHLFQYLADVALWSWLADLAAPRVRGLFLGRRERWMLGGAILGMLASGGFSYVWRKLPGGTALAWLGYALPATAGAVLMIAALAPLLRMPSLVSRRVRRPSPGLTRLAAPLADRNFLRLLLFGCWFSFFNGAFQSPQDYYPIHVLAISLLTTNCLAIVLRGGQWLLSPWVGQQADRQGNRPVMMISLAVVAAGPLFYFLSTPAQPWWFAGAWLMWIAYAGLNVGLPNLLLKSSPRGSNTSYIASYYALTGLCMAASTILGGQLFDQFRDRLFDVPLAGRLDYYHVAFLSAWLMRSLGIALLWMVPETISPAAAAAFPPAASTGQLPACPKTGIL